MNKSSRLTLLIGGIASFIAAACTSFHWLHELYFITHLPQALQPLMTRQGFWVLFAAVMLLSATVIVLIRKRKAPAKPVAPASTPITSPDGELPVMCSPGVTVTSPPMPSQAIASSATSRSTVSSDAPAAWQWSWIVFCVGILLWLLIKLIRKTKTSPKALTVDGSEMNSTVVAPPAVHVWPSSRFARRDPPPTVWRTVITHQRTIVDWQFTTATEMKGWRPNSR